MNLLPSLDQLKPLPPADEELRQRAFEFVSEKGLPTKRDEDWRYTSLKPLNDERFLSAVLKDVASSHDTLKDVADRLNPEFLNLVFINGKLDRTLSSLEDLPETVQWSTDVGAGGFNDVIEALSVVNLGHGVTLKISADAALEKPLCLHFHTSLEGGPALMVSPRILMEVGARTTLTLIESYSGQAGARYFVNAHTEVMTGTSAQLTYVRVQEESLRALHVGRTRLRPGAGSEIVSLVHSSGAALFRHNLEATLNDTGTSVKTLGVVAASGEQHVDNATEIDHQAGGSTSSQIYKSLLAGKSRSVFTGRIRIRPDAQKVQSEQLNQSLLLSAQAEADSRPQLMIEADDVKAAHGATVGQINPEELFYLMSRGISREHATSLLSAGFLSSVVEELGSPSVRKWLTARVAAILPRLQESP